MKIGQIVNLECEYNAFDDQGVHYTMTPGTTALVLDSNDYDITFLCFGVVLYISTGSFEDNGLLS